MKLRLLSFAAAKTVAVLSLLVGCSEENPQPSGTGGSPSGGASGAPGSGGQLSGGTSSGGATSGGSAGAGGSGLAGSGGTAGIAGTAGMAGGGTAGGGNGGANGGSAGNGGIGGTAGNGGAGGGGNGGASGSASGGDTGYPATFDTVKLVLTGTNPACGASDCHDGHVRQPALIDGAELHTTLTTYMAPLCENLPLVDPGNPDGSALVKALRGDCPQAEQMPKGCKDTGTCVDELYIQTIEQWIANGAPQ